eukprot:CAMPEP_0172396904 /NCGR_PEP_ID=MMETSP1061-20121228/27727_1 /TAXON_ID=37318 /ORGANISM="Pseudo-nitzschia pungens, Strain cf. pungens" /LENGTH=151 /DNA_ID=CAMNT_0013128895 /DNA_START=433 /DNA_END=885 /DNA_ORIENTATION=+
MSRSRAGVGVGAGAAQKIAGSCSYIRLCILLIGSTLSPLFPPLPDPHPSALVERVLVLVVVVPTKRVPLPTGTARPAPRQRNGRKRGHRLVAGGMDDPFVVEDCSDIAAAGKGQVGRAQPGHSTQDTRQQQRQVALGSGPAAPGGGRSRSF